MHKFNHRTYRWIVIAALALAGCGAIPFDVEQNIPQQTVAGNPNPLAMLFPSLLQVPITVDIQSETQRRSTGPAHSAVLRALSLSATPHATPSGNFDFLDEIHIYVASPSNSSLPKKEIATLNPVPRGQTSVNFAVAPEIDLLPYINSGAQITSSATGRQPTKDFTFDGRVVITVRF